MTHSCTPTLAHTPTPTHMFSCPNSTCIMQSYGYVANNNYIQSQTNHTFELGLSLQEQVGEAGLVEGWDSIHFSKS